MSKIHQRANQFGVVTALITRTGSYFRKKYPVILVVGLISIVAACESQSTDDVSSGFAGVGGDGLQIQMSVTELTDVSDLVVTGEVLSAELVQPYDFSDGTESSNFFVHCHHQHIIFRSASRSILTSKEKAVRSSLLLSQD
jgi:hypothetical protein